MFEYCPLRKYIPQGKCLHFMLHEMQYLPAFDCFFFIKNWIWLVIINRSFKNSIFLKRFTLKFSLLKRAYLPKPFLLQASTRKESE
ncbi:hypothetical protein BpHYR1_023807 [Brachionus plicatilis]|uniref:Uncharacterized protein n=1 Tax=Brachionus plicatilis TaxID=10195 RepID=A0A3M7Q5G4_BRAPC|nr:hypothetical protein BpHYR1_023807 [Brachionus plicatilis]